MASQPDHCPLCHQPNGCALAADASGKTQCWCMAHSFPDKSEPAMAAALAGSVDGACLCRYCVQRLAARVP